METDKLRLKDLLSQKIISEPIESEYKKYIEYKTLISTPYLVFEYTRKNMNGKINSNIIIPDKYIILNDENEYKYSLHAVVCYIEDLGHYTLYFRCGIDWFYYDDLMDGIEYVGNYKDLLEQEDPILLKTGTLFFYEKIQHNDDNEYYDLKDLI